MIIFLLLLLVGWHGVLSVQLDRIEQQLIKLRQERRT